MLLSKPQHRRTHQRHGCSGLVHQRRSKDERPWQNNEKKAPKEGNKKRLVSVDETGSSRRNTKGKQVEQKGRRNPGKKDSNQLVHKTSSFWPIQKEIGRASCRERV